MLGAGRVEPVPRLVPAPPLTLSGTAHAGAAQITPTELALTVVYILASPRTGVHEIALQVVPIEVRMWGHDFPPSGGAVPARTGLASIDLNLPLSLSVSAA